MEARTWQRAQHLFHAAADLSPDEQAAFVAAAAEDDLELSALLAAMLDPTFKRLADIEEYLRLPVLGTVRAGVG